MAGVTILESTGFVRMRRALRDDLPLMPSLRGLLAGRELHHRTLFAIIKDAAVLEQAVAATEQLIGDFAQPHTGILFVVPVVRVLGLDKRRRD